jgi:hypothetical protein
MNDLDAEFALDAGASLVDPVTTAVFDFRIMIDSGCA